MSLIKQGGILPMKKVILNSNSNIEITALDGSLYNLITKEHTRQYYRAISLEDKNTITCIYDALLDVEYWSYANKLEGIDGLISNSGFPDIDEYLVRNYLEDFVGKNNVNLPVKSSYKLNTIIANNECLSYGINKPLPLEWSIEMRITNKVSSNTQVILGNSSSIRSKITLFGGGKIQIISDTSGSALSDSILPITGTYILKLIHKLDHTTDVYVNGLFVGIVGAVTGTFSFFYIGRISTGYFEGEFEWFNYNGDYFPFNEGSGNKTYSINGTELTLLSTLSTDAMWEEIV